MAVLRCRHLFRDATLFRRNELHLSKQVGFCNNSPIDDNDVNKKETSMNKKAEKKEAAKKKLNELLLSLSSVDPISEQKSTVNINRFTPRHWQKKPLNQAEQIIPQELPEGEKILAAVKDVVEIVGGETTESELLTSLRSLNAPDKSLINLSELIVGMKVERSKPTPAIEKRFQYPLSENIHEVASNTRKFDRGSYQPHPRKITTRDFVRTDIFGGRRLDVFNKTSLGPSSASFLKTWDAINARELALMLENPPANGFQEMIQWTRQGKLWTFPIDNEVGLEDEKKVGFHEHVFLEPHLDGWCPIKGPIRHFMELVCNGLSHNPYLTVERKKAHIYWYKDYFEKKQDLLKDVGAI